ncbi:MAG: hypothetical protein KAT65_27355 [Methanophagales archaeon]|nr:hypothetical protein [Methanophagales archaeon]
MIENTTNLTNTTILVGTLEIMKNFASEHLEAITAIIVAAATSGGLVWMIVSTRAQRKHERAMQQAQHKHEREMEKLRQDYDEKIRQQPKQIAIDRLKSRLERFVSCWEEDKESVLEERIERKKKLREKLFLIGNELKEEAKEDKKLVSLIIEEGVRDIGDGIINLSSKIAHEAIVANEDKEKTRQRHQKIVVKGDNLIERAKELIEELQQEG